MNNNTALIMTVLGEYLNANPSIRFGQALYNLNINQFVNDKDPDKGNYALRDIYNDTDDEILKRINPK